MKKIRQRKGWGIYALNAREQLEFDFKFAAIHPDMMGVSGLDPSDSDWEFQSEEEAISWIDNYDE